MGGVLGRNPRSSFNRNAAYRLLMMAIAARPMGAREHKMQVIVPDTITVTLGREAIYGTLAVDTARLPPQAIEFLWDYGLKQKLNDAIATKTDKDGRGLSKAEIFAKAQAMLEALYSGELRRHSAQEPADPVEREAFALAKSAMTMAYKDRGDWAQVPKGTKDRFAAMIRIRRKARNLPEMPDDEAVADALAQYLAVNPAIRVQAERNVREAEEAAAAAADIL